MRLTQIKLAGFKSFVDPTVVQVPSQLVGVVGPNGCGKSNIIDAVRWVLGETRASELRGESMQDVIFNGSVQRKPAARASVELVFDNEAGRAAGQWSQYAEISVRRVLTRDGNSSYHINNQQVRRRDIHDIFLGTGLGTRGYAIIGQGMISRIIEARPEELRIFLEEAAGVSRYKERRRETAHRLEDTRENLTRVEDILRELTGQLEKLEAQAEVAERYHHLQQLGEQSLHGLWFLKKREADANRERAALATEQAQTALEAAAADMRREEAGLTALRQAHYEASDAVHAAQGALYAANAEVSRLEAEIRFVVDGARRLQTQESQLLERLERARAERDESTDATAEAELAQEEAAARAETAQIQLDAAHDALPALEQQLRESQNALAALRGEVARVEQAIALSAQTRGEADRQLQQLQQRRERLEAQQRQVEAPDPQRLQHLAGELAQLEQQQREADAALQALEQRLPEADAWRRERQQAAQAEGAAVASIEARLAALTQLQTDVQQQGELQPWLEGRELAARPRLWQRLQIAPGWETALESVLRERLAAIEMNDLAWAHGYLDQPPPSRLAFYQMPAPAPAADPAPSGWQRLGSLLQLQDPGLRTLMTGWLDRVYVRESLQAALASRAELGPDDCFVVPEGHLVDRHGVRFYAADSEQAGMLARQQEIDNLQRELKAAQLLADEARQAAARAEAQYDHEAQALPAARQRVAELTRHQHRLQLDHERLQQQLDRSSAEARRLSDELAELATQEEHWLAERDEADARFETFDAELAEAQERQADAEMQLEALEADTSRARERVRDAERAAQEAGFAERAAVARIAELQRLAERAVSQAEADTVALTEVRQELQTLDDAAARAGLQQALAERAATEESLTRARTELDDLHTRLRAADEQRLRLEQSLDPQRARITELQLEEQAARLAQEQFAQQLQDHQVDVVALQAWLDTLPEAQRRASWLQGEVQRITRDVNALGAVNLAALEELKTARERQGFLASQQQDLVTAIETLEDAIRKIDRETRQLLQETFDAVNGHFGQLFPQLFGGGEARLAMTGEEILDAGVQVMAQPPGKRNSTIHLLSGGEKALTATALVFALFKLNPAPFCLLDEVDAPLDDANTERYANLVRSMSEHTQFLFISHNKIAMEMAHQLVGVTMQEQGVSRIVAVDIDVAVRMTADAA